MVRQINPGLARLMGENGSRQYGYREPLTLSTLSPGQHRALDFLEHGIADQQLELLPKMASADPVEVKDLMQRLGSYLRATSSFLPEFTDLEVQSRFREILRLFASTNLDPAQALKTRKLAKVYLDSFSPFGLTFTQGLASAGVGVVITDDQKRTKPEDLGAMGFAIEQLGTARAIAAREKLLGQIAIRHHSRTTSSYDSVDVAILNSSDVLSPKRYQRWLSRDIPHLLVRFDEKGVEVSHLVIPGITPCLGCAELARIRSDPSWLALATQLDYLERDLADSTSVLFGASIALARTLERIDNPLVHQRPTTLRLEHGVGVFELEPADQNCGCR